MTLDDIENLIEEITNDYKQSIKKQKEIKEMIESIKKEKYKNCAIENSIEISKCQNGI